jgi:hypothetical protein
MARTLMNLVSIPVLMRTRHNEVRFMKQFDEGLSKEQLASIFHSKFFDIIPGVQGQQDRLTKSEFILLLLHMMNKIDLKQVMIAGHLFDKMDKERTGQLTMDKLTKEMDLAMSEQEIEDMRRMSKEIDISQRGGPVCSQDLNFGVALRISIPAIVTAIVATTECVASQ